MKTKRSLPEILKQPLKVSKFVQLYLIKRQNHFKFHFLDMLNNQFIIEIGPLINCSCIPGYFDHCIHSFYVLQKIFKIKEDDPLLWKQKYTIKDLQVLIQTQKQIKVKNKQILRDLKSMNTQFNIQFNQSIIKLENKHEQQKLDYRHKQIQSNQKQSPKKPINYSASLVKDSQKKLYNQLLNEVKLIMQKQQEELFGQEQPRCCPICHQNITYETSAYQCKQKCKNYYHIKCLKFWVKHQRKSIIQNDRVDQESFQHRSHIRVTCPMCRTKFPQNIDSQLTQSDTKFKKYYQSQNITCNECSQQIYLKLYHCLLCKDINVCDSCYKGWKHQRHDRFLMLPHKKAKWQVPPSRSACSMTKLEFSLEYIKKISTETKVEGQIKQLLGQNYSKFLQSNLPKPDMLEYLKQTFVNVEKEIHKTYKQVDFNEDSIKCIACKKSSIVGMKRMFCNGKHFIDQKCLNFFLKNNLFQCPLEKSFILEGLEGIKLNLKQTNKKSLKQKK